MDIQLSIPYVVTVKNKSEKFKNVSLFSYDKEDKDVKFTTVVNKKKKKSKRKDDDEKFKWFIS